MNNNTVWHSSIITRAHREKQNEHKSIVLWYTGLPSSGKSTLAHAVEEKRYSIGYRSFVLDGDNVRQKLCSDLGFSIQDRKENIRRIAQVANLFKEAGFIIMTAFISPFRDDRQYAKELIGESDFVEIFCNCDIEICEQHDTKGHYREARLGVIKEFTGISSPYEVPENPDLNIVTGKLPLEECVNIIVSYLRDNGIIKN